MSDISQPRPVTGSPPTGFTFPQRSVGLKLLLVCALALLMSIPAMFVFDIVRDRSNGENRAMSEVSQTMGGRQTVLGPFIAVPYSQAISSKRPNDRIYGIALAFPETGEIMSDVTVTKRQRGIHVIPVFDTKLSMTAELDPSALRKAIPEDAEPIWRDAALYFGLSDMRGLKDALTVTTNGTSLEMGPAPKSVPNPETYKNTPVSYDLSLARSLWPALETATAPIKIKASTRFTGADTLSFLPFAKDTKVALTSNWNDPGFNGMLPTDHTAQGEISDGFQANWRIPYMARNIVGSGAQIDLDSIARDPSNQMSVRFMNDVSPYQSVERALKYAVMFVGFVFLAYFLFEVSSSARAHPAQYVLVGLTQTIFYVLLLALAERIGFDGAFAIAATMTVSLTSLYAMSVFKSKTYGLRAFGLLSGIYTLIYVLMRAEDHALLAGAFASFAAIAVTMYMTRNIDWYGNRGQTAAS